MKTVKFLGMLLTAFTLSFTLTACGDDEPTPDPSQGNGEIDVPNIASQGILKIKNETAIFLEGMAHSPESDGINIMFEAEEDGKTSSLAIVLFNVALQNGKIPTGKYPLVTRDNSIELDNQPHFFLSGSLNIATDEERNYVGGYFFNATDGTSELAIDFDGNSYTLHIKKLEVSYREAADPSYEYKTETTEFTYKGKLNIRNMER